MLALLAAMAIATPTPIDLEKVNTAVAPIFKAYQSVEVAEALAAEPKTLAEKLLRLEHLDQAGRTALSDVSFAGLTPEELGAARRAIWDEIGAHDRVDLVELEALFPKSGWFRISDVGKEPARGAWYVIQHADLDAQKAALERMKPLAGTPELEGQLYGLLMDRTELESGRKQIFGSQTRCENGKYVVYELQDPKNVDRRRSAMGFKETEAQYMKNFENEPCH